MDVVNNNEEIKTLLVRGTIRDFNRIVVIGLAGSGKTYLSELLSKSCPDHAILHSDEYMHHGYAESLYVMISDIKALRGDPAIIEGIQAYRALRKGIENQDFFPDLVITCECDRTTLFRRREERKAIQANQEALDKNLQKVYLDYLNLLDALPVLPRPKFLTYQTAI